MKGSALVDVMSPAAMSYYAHLCGWTLARAHARSGDSIAISEYLGESDAFDHAIARFAKDTPSKTSATSANLFVLSSQDASRRTKACEAMSGIATRYPGLGVLDSRALPAHHRSDPAAL